MRLLMFREGESRRVGALQGDKVVDLGRLADGQLGEPLPRTLLKLIEAGDPALDLARRCLAALDGITNRESHQHAVQERSILAPLDPPRGNIVAIGRNFAAHARESAQARNEEVAPPTVFTKAQTSIIGPFDDIPYPEGITQQLDYEAELGVVIGKRALNVSEEDALTHVFGYTVLNDVSARDVQFGWGGQFFKGKSLDGSCPVGPWLVTRDEVPDPQNLQIRLRLNGETRQDANTSDMIHTVAELVSRLSQGMTLPPGTLIATGTPEGVGMGRTPPTFLAAGDVIETEIVGIGTMRNVVR